MPAGRTSAATSREPVIMDTHKARRQLGWHPRHDALTTLRETIAAHRMETIVR